jgi:hypothetical protein
MTALRNLLIAVDMAAIIILALLFDGLPTRWIFNLSVFMVAVLGAITLLQYAMRNETR